MICHCWLPAWSQSLPALHLQLCMCLHVCYIAGISAPAQNSFAVGFSSVMNISLVLAQKRSKCWPLYCARHLLWYTKVVSRLYSSQTGPCLNKGGWTYVYSLRGPMVKSVNTVQPSLLPSHDPGKFGFFNTGTLGRRFLYLILIWELFPHMSFLWLYLVPAFFLPECLSVWLHCCIFRHSLRSCLGCNRKLGATKGWLIMKSWLLFWLWNDS